jgi:hypothetical protein
VRPLSALELLTAWDRGAVEQPLERPLTLLAAAYGVPAGSLAATSLGHRDALLLSLREQIFGARLTGLATCPGCVGELEVAFEVDEVRADGQGTDPAAAAPRSLAAGGYQLAVRVPDSRDAVAAANARADPAATRALLLDRCVSARDRKGRPVAAADLPAEVAAAAVASMAEADPQADVRLALACPTCGTSWEVPFDAGSFLWAEVEAWARRTLLEVHQLAAVYGWSEAEVLELGPRRRQAYLELIGA